MHVSGSFRQAVFSVIAVEHRPRLHRHVQAIDVEIQAREMMYHATTLNRIMSEYTGQTIEQVRKSVCISKLCAHCRITASRSHMQVKLQGTPSPHSQPRMSSHVQSSRPRAQCSQKFSLSLRLQEAFTQLCVVQIEIDTDRDNYMSPLEAKHYGIIDHVVGGDDAGYQMEGSTLAFTKRRLSQDTSDNPNVRCSQLFCMQCAEL